MKSGDGLAVTDELLMSFTSCSFPFVSWYSDSDPVRCFLPAGGVFDFPV